MHKLITRSLFSAAMLSLALSNGIDVYRKLNLPPQSGIRAPVIPVINPVSPKEVGQLAESVPAKPVLQLAAEPVRSIPFKPFVPPSRATARTSEQTSRLLAAVAAANPRASPNKSSCFNGR